MRLIPYLKIIRYSNALMAAVTVFLGYWLSDSTLPVNSLLLLAFATICSTGFGNVINDIIDIDSDRISHPHRPLPTGDISVNSAKLYSVFLVTLALTCSFSVSFLYGMATLLPLIFLTFYAFFLKATPIAGNLIVAGLVAYTILYGAIGTSGFNRLILPAALAFLLNFSREIVKDLQDLEGDRSSGIITSAILPQPVLKTIILISSLSYLVILASTIIMKQFGIYYAIISLGIALPIHACRTTLILQNGWENRLKNISSLFKFEMLSGLVALAADKFC